MLISSWREWGSAEAIGVGRQEVDSCKPDCASGQVTYVPVTIKLFDVNDGRYTLITETPSLGLPGPFYPTSELNGAVG